MTSVQGFIDKWREHVEAIQLGLREANRSSRLGALPTLVYTLWRGRSIALRLNVHWKSGQNGIPDLILLPLKQAHKAFKLSAVAGGDMISETGLVLEDGPRTIHFNGVALHIKKGGHAVETRITGRVGYDSKITLQLDAVALAPVSAESNVQRGAEQNMSAAEVVRESTGFSASAGPPIVVAAAASGPFLELYFDNAQPGRDAVWRAALKIQDRYELTSPEEQLVTHVTHAPFMVAQVKPPQFDPEGGSILAQWKSDDQDGAQWRFAVDTVHLRLMAQAVGESMVRGRRFTDDTQPGCGLDQRRPVNSRFSRATDISVRPVRTVRRYTVHPGDVLTVLRDAQLQRLVSEMAYPLEFTYQRTPESKRDVVVSELGQWLGEPAISLAIDDADLSRALGESMSAGLAHWYLAGRRPPSTSIFPHSVYSMQRARHLANRGSFHHRISQFRLLDSSHPERKLDLAEGMSARLRSKTRDTDKGEGAVPVYPLPLQVELSPQAAASTANFVADAQADIDTARSMPIGLINMIEFSSELVGVLAAPEASDVCLTDLTLSVLGATGAMKAAFDEGRTVFEVEAADGQLVRAIKTRVGRIGATWNRAIHVVVYERSTVPGAQFANEQPTMGGRPLIRKMNEYIDILEPQRMFSAETSVQENRVGCLHSFAFATKRIYVNGAWGRDLNGEGYEIPLFNPDDPSGFYSKPWLGPVAESGSKDLVRHWHEHPQDMVFYTSTVPGAGADTDAWPAVPIVDIDRYPTFSNIATAQLAPVAANLAFKRMPSYNLAAADNPRFAMRVTADGPSNVTHGRGTDKLVALLRTVHIERTMARSRLRFDQGGALASLVKGTDDLWNSAKASAEVKSIEATLALVTSDANALLDAFGQPQDLALGCAALKDKLRSKIGESFDQARNRMDVPLKTALNAIDVSAVVELVQQQRQQVLNTLTGCIGIPVALLGAGCAHAERAIDAMRFRVGQFGDAVDAASAEILARIEDDHEAIGLRRMFERAAGGLEGPLRAAQRGEAALAQMRRELNAKWAVVKGEADALLADLQTVHDGAAAQLHENALNWIDQAPDRLNKITAQVDHAIAALREVKLPESMVALGTGQQNCWQALVRGKALLAAFKEGIPGVRTEVEEIDAAAQVLIQGKLQAKFFQPYAALTGTVQSLVGAASLTTVALENVLHGAAGKITSHKASMIACPFDVPLKAALDGLRVIVVAGSGSLLEVKALLDRALLTLRGAVTGAHQNVESEIVRLHRLAVKEVGGELKTMADGLTAPFTDAQTAMCTTLTNSAGTLHAALGAQQAIILNGIDALDCTAWDTFRADLKCRVDALVADARDQLTDAAAGMLDQDTRRRLNALKNEIENKVNAGDAALKEAYDAVAPRAGQALKLVKLLSDPPELPHITINTSRLEYVFDDVATQIQTSPFVARLREVETGLAELGIANPCRALDAGMITDKLDGLNFTDVFKDLALKFEHFFEAFKLQSFPSDAIKFSHHIDEKKRRAEAKAEIHHQFQSTEPLFDIAAFTLDIRKPKIDATSDFEIAEGETGKARTNAIFGGDWILNFGGQMLVEFTDAQVQYSDAAGFNFNLDPKNVKLAKPLEYIATVFKAMMPGLPETVKIIKDDKGLPIGARIEQNNAIGPFDFGALFIGETVLGTGFGLLVDQGSMKIDTCFNVGDTASPVFMQIGIYGGGGWLKARAYADVVNGGLELGYAASIGVSLGSARAFTLAGVASGTYALRMFVEATFQSKGGNSFVAGLSLNGSARVLGYLNAYLSLLLQVEHKGGSMSGSGSLDIEIEVCWCYSVRVSRTVQQSM